MIVSINPTYYCNFRCSFCYLTPEQLNDRTLIPVEVIEQKIKEIQNHKKISMVDLYGGEVGLLPDVYVEDLADMLYRNQIDDINIITNLSMINRVIQNPKFYVSVSYDFDAREQSDRVWNNMFLLEREFSILILASKAVIEKDVEEMILNLNMISNLKSVEIKPYSTNQANHHSVTHKNFENFVEKWINSPVEKKFLFVNETNINAVIDGTKNAFSNDHVYITPDGKFAVLEFDLNDREYFKSLDTFNDYLLWAKQEPDKNISNICKNCEYYGKCLTEHYRYVRDLENGCNGYKSLIDWYKNGRMEN
jgi:sulfatase maturation enzyme AslB (radical SAM superfamily)